MRNDKEATKNFMIIIIKSSSMLIKNLRANYLKIIGNKKGKRPFGNNEHFFIYSH